MYQTHESNIALSALLTVAALTLGTGACSDKSSSDVVVKPVGSTPPTQVSNEPIPGVDTSALDASKLKRFNQLVTSLHSPCGKAHSLRTSATQDKSCKRALFALRYVLETLVDEASDEEVRQSYNRHYKPASKVTFTLKDSMPHHGPTDAPVQLVEFYDYACPACKSFVPVLDEVVQTMHNQVVLYYRQLPLPQHKNSKPAAQAALAAHAQGKFKEMHDLLFANAPGHERPQLTKYAESVGLDMARFDVDFAAAAPRVDADGKDGVRAGVRKTPSLYINGRLYDGPLRAKYLLMWIEEELEVAR